MTYLCVPRMNLLFLFSGLSLRVFSHKTNQIKIMIHERHGFQEPMHGIEPFLLLLLWCTQVITQKVVYIYFRLVDLFDMWSRAHGAVRCATVR